MLSLHKKKRIALSVLVASIVVLPAVVFATNKLSSTSDTHAITYIMPDGYTGIVDPNFYDCVVEAYKATYPAVEIPETGITDEQIATIDTLVCNSRAEGEKITDTTGLEKMPRMAYLDLSSNEISSIDVSSFNLLTYLNLHSNRLTSVNVSNNTGLRNLYLNNNQIEYINLANNTELRNIDLSNNELAVLNVSSNTKIINLYLSNNQLDFLNISNNTALTALNVDGNALTALNVSENVSLADLMSDDIMVYADLTPTLDNGNYVYDLSDLAFLQDGYHEGFIVDFTIGNTASYSYDKTNMLLTVNDIDGAGDYVQITGTDDKDNGGFSYKFALPFILDYDVNGGSGNFNTYLCYSNGTTSGCGFDIPTDVPTWAGHNFIGWADSASATTANYEAGDPITITGHKTLYAVWDLVTSSATLSFNMNGGEGTVASQSCTLDVDHPNCNVTIPNTIPTRNGYNFIGWANSDSATSANYEAGDNVNISGNKTLYAVWTLITTPVSLSFNLNGGEGIFTPQNCTLDINHPTCDVTIPNGVPTRNGYNFLGWADSSSATTANYHGGDSLTLTGNKTIYAVWEIITSSATLSFNINGGEGIVTPQDCTLDINHPTCDVTIPNGVPTRNGYNFLGWADSSSATTANYHGGDSLTLTGNKTIYAVWELITTPVTLSFNVNGGEGTVASRTCALDINHASCNVTIPNTVPTKEGYDFLGWADSDTATTADYERGGSITLTADKTVYAVWKEAQSEEPGGDESGDDESGDDTPVDDKTDDEDEVVVPDTSAPETGANTMKMEDGSVMVTVGVISSIVIVVAFVMLYRNKQDDVE